MKDMVIDACKWYVDDGTEDQMKAEVVRAFRNRYTPLLSFFKEVGLICSEAILDEDEDWLGFELKMSDFTEEGLELLMCCHDQWLDAISRGLSPSNISLWQRQLVRLREEEPVLLH